MEADYTDTYATTVQSINHMTASDLFYLMFVCYPKFILYLLRLRDGVVKPFGLPTGSNFTELIQEQSKEKVVCSKSDKHLTFRIQLECDTPDTCIQCQSIRITTSVKFHNTQGRIYFFFIHPFHCLICKILLKRAARNWEKETHSRIVQKNDRKTFKKQITHINQP